jgi:phosphatidylinositol-3-phosphatase
MGRALVRISGGIVAVGLAVSGCTKPSAPPGPAIPQPTPTASSLSTSPSPPGYPKVLIIVEENHSYEEIIGDPAAPYLNHLATTYGLATNMSAGYPTGCPSLAAYILLTSGSRHGICDDDDPSAHRLTGPNIFAQVVAAGGEWRNYAESAPTTCATTNARNNHFLVRHTPAPYYVSETERCRRWDVPLGDPTTGALHDDLAAGRLPTYGFISPDACDDMHGAPACPANIGAGDRWLQSWVPMILSSADYTAHRLVVIITWDEGTETTNHLPTLVISPTTSHVRSATAYTHCSILRTVEDVLRLAPLGCAAHAASMVAAFHLSAG